MNLKLLYLVLIIGTQTVAQVGINTMSPTAVLDIDGDLRIRNIPVETIMEVAQDSVLVISRDGRVKTISATEITDKALPSMVKGSFVGSGLVNLSLSSGSQVIPFDQKDIDANNEWDTTANEFTAKQDGIYVVNVQIEADATLGIANSFGVQILKNSIIETRSTYANIGVVGSNVTPPVRTTHTLLQLSTGDTLHFQIEGDVALGTVAILGSNQDSFFTIHQIR
jgi:hypothetical protein